MIQYTYYSAATDLHPNKEGVNRITWEDNGSENSSDWIEITREYFSIDPRNKTGIALQSLLSATPEELETIKFYLGIKA
jgi:hypothetical protein